MANADDLIAYWSLLGTASVHPDDRAHIDGGQFATTLAPVPWAGPLKTAKAYLLFLNPGLSTADESYETDNAAFSRTLDANLRQGTQPYFYLREDFSDHSGHAWARATFGPDIGENRADRFCVVQLVPYHSKEGAIARRIAPRLPSSNAVRRFVGDWLVPRARAGEIGLIVARSARLWKIDAAAETDTLIVYRGWECRRALQTANTRGGRLLRKMI